jgi:hypothetical protein
MPHALTAAIAIYFIIGLSITGFCVHMSYHEAAVGFGDSHDAKAQKVLESKIGPLGFIFLFTFWPIAMIVAFTGQAKADVAASTHGEHAAQPSAAQGSPAVPAEQSK